MHEPVKKSSLLIAAAVMTLAASPLFSVELLTDGAFEFGAAIPEWELAESIYDQGTMMPRDFGNVNSAQQQGFGPQSGSLALWLRAFVGRQPPGPDTLTNASLSQTVPAVVGEEYTFSGWSRWELNYSGGVTMLNPNGPLGAVASPTETTMELAFLDSNGSVMGMPTALDLRTEQNNLDFWRQHLLTATAPTGADRVRVTASATAMLWNGGTMESAFYDNFSLTTTNDPMTQLLANPDLEDDQPYFEPAWMIVEVPGGRIPDDPTVSTADFANRPESGGQLGVWLRSFTGNSAQPADAIISQTVAAVPGGEYTFSGWSSFQANYPGGLINFNTQTLMEMAFLDGGGNAIGTPQTLDLFADGQTNGAGWRQHTINGIAPPGTVSVRVTGAGLDMEFNPVGGQQSAFFDDFSLMVQLSVDGDFNDDGNYDCLDIDGLGAAIAGGTHPAAFDLTGDSLVNLADRDAWLVEAGNVNLGAGRTYLLGDATLDGVVDGSDFGLWNSHKFTSTAAWCSGDFTADGVVDGSDFGLWNANKFTSAVSAVPEPSSALVLMLLLSYCQFSHRKAP